MSGDDYKGDDSFEDADLGKFLEEDDDIKPIDSDIERPDTKGRNSQSANPDNDKPDDQSARSDDDISLEESYESFLNPGGRRTAETDMRARKAGGGTSSTPNSDNDPTPKAQAAGSDLPPVPGEEDRNIIHPGEYCDLSEVTTGLKKLMIGAGWDQRRPDAEPVDVDISLFMLNKNDETRVDEDFVFYNNPETLEGAVQHLGDSRTGAGDGDDENILLELNGIPFDILKIMIVLSIYDEDMNDHHFNMVRNMFVRLVNHDDGEEIVYFKLADDGYEDAKCVYAATLIREGARWVFEAHGKPTNEDLAAVAIKYGLIIREVQSTGHEHDSEHSS